MTQTERAKWDGVERRQPWFRFLWSMNLGTVVTVGSIIGAAFTLTLTIGRQYEHVLNSIEAESTARQNQSSALQSTLNDISGSVNMRLDYVEKREHADIENMLARFGDLQRSVHDMAVRRQLNQRDDVPEPSSPHEDHG